MLATDCSEPEILNALARQFDMFADRYRDLGLMAGVISADNPDVAERHLRRLIPELEACAIRFLGWERVDYRLDTSFHAVSSFDDGEPIFSAADDAEHSLIPVLGVLFPYGDVKAWGAFTDLCTAAGSTLSGGQRWIMGIEPYNQWIHVLSSPFENAFGFVNYAWVENGRFVMLKNHKHRHDPYGRILNFIVHPAIASAAFCRTLARDLQMCQGKTARGGEPTDLTCVTRNWPNGPTDDGRFLWNNHPIPLPCKQLKLLQEVWSQVGGRSGRARLAPIVDRVWEDSVKSVTALPSLMSRLNDFLARKGVPIALSRSRDFIELVIDE